MEGDEAERREYKIIFICGEGKAGLVRNWENALRKNRRPSGLVGKETVCNAGDMGDRFDSWVGKIPWGRAQQPTTVFLSEKSHGQRKLAGYNP